MILKALYRTFLLLFAVCLTTESLVSAERVEASDSRITWVGRTLVTDGSVSFDWTGVYCRIRFKGDVLRLKIGDTGRNYYNVYIDRKMSEEPSQVLTVQSDSIYVLTMPRSRKVHEVVLQKRTEAEQGRTTFYALETDGHFLQAEPLRKLQVEFIGDSYTCGYGVESQDSLEHFTPETENVCKSFVSLVAQRLNADYHVIAHSGMGICRNYNSKFPDWTMPKRHHFTFDMDSVNYPWQGQDGWRPMVIIMLGGNDFSCGVTPDFEKFKREYFELLSQLDDSMIVVCCTKTRDTELSRYVEQVVLECNHSNAYFFAADFDDYTNHREYLGADKHPNAKAHRRLAEQILAYIRQFF